MEQSRTNGIDAGLAQYETPFADIPVMREQPEPIVSYDKFFSDLFQQHESPFSRTYDVALNGQLPSQVNEEFVDFLAELNDPSFNEVLYQMADEVEDTWRSKVSNEIALGDNYLPFAARQARDYFAPVLRETDSLIDRISNHFSGNDLADQSEAQIDHFFSNLEFNQDSYTPVQDQFFGKIIDSVKKVVKKGASLVKKGISAVGKILPINIILNKIKGLVKPLLDKVLKFAIGKLPKQLQPHAQNLAKKFLNMETIDETASDSSLTGNEVDGIQTEFNSHLAQLVFAPGEEEAQIVTTDYEFSDQAMERSGNYEMANVSAPSLDAAREVLINELKNLPAGDNPAPAIERFLPAAMMALQPAIKIAISIVGRQKVINFLAGLLAKLISKYVPATVVKPLAANIIDVGMGAIGFEVHETNNADLGYEAIANTIQDTIQNLAVANEAALNDTDELTMNLLQAFEQAAASNFPPQYIKEELRPSRQRGTWVAMPRNLPVKFYKKFTHVYDVTIDPQMAATVTTFRSLPLANFLKDKYGLDPAKSIRAKVHLYEMNKSGRLSMLGKFENLPGLNSKQPKAWIQLLPLTKQAATLILKEPAMGKDPDAKALATRFKTLPGQRYYYLEIEGARLRIPPVLSSRQKSSDTSQRPRVSESRSADIQAVLNFIKSEIRLNYYFSEEDAKAVIEKLNSNDYLGAAMNIRQSVKSVLNDILIKNVQSKVKIVHEAVPEMYLESIVDQQQFEPMAILGKVAGKDIIAKLVQQLIEKIAGKAYDSVVAFFKARAAEFKQAQAQPQDGVTIKLAWTKVGGMSAIRTVINAIRGNLSLGSLSDLSIPSFSAPEISIEADKRFD